MCPGAHGSRTASSRRPVAMSCLSRASHTAYELVDWDWGSSTRGRSAGGGSAAAVSTASGASNASTSVVVVSCSSSGRAAEAMRPECVPARPLPAAARRATRPMPSRVGVSAPPVGAWAPSANGEGDLNEAAGCSAATAAAAALSVLVLLALLLLLLLAKKLFILTMLPCLVSAPAVGEDSAPPSKSELPKTFSNLLPMRRSRSASLSC